MISVSEYLLGHADPELEHLQLQACCLEGPTRRLVKECGIEPGIRVLDVGSGVGVLNHALFDAAIGPCVRIHQALRSCLVTNVQSRRSQAP